MTKFEVRESTKTGNHQEATDALARLLLEYARKQLEQEKTAAK